MPELVEAVYLGLNMTDNNIRLIKKTVDMINKTQKRNIKIYESTGVDNSNNIRFKVVDE